MSDCRTTNPSPLRHHERGEAHLAWSTLKKADIGRTRGVEWPFSGGRDQPGNQSEQMSSDAKTARIGDVSFRSWKHAKEFGRERYGSRATREPFCPTTPCGSACSCSVRAAARAGVVTTFRGAAAPPCKPPCRMTAAWSSEGGRAVCGRSILGRCWHPNP